MISPFAAMCVPERTLQDRVTGHHDNDDMYMTLATHVFNTWHMLPYRLHARPYNTDNFRVWLASITDLPTRSARHLLQDSQPGKLLVLGFALAKQPGLPDAETLDAKVQDRTTAQNVAAMFAEADLFVPEFKDSIAVGLVVAANVSAVVQRAQDFTTFAPIGK